MSRSTQFIGLTQTGRKLVEAMTPTPDKTNKTYGMFDELIPLGVWIDKQGTIFKEIVQAEPWSSGPMIFTCLQNTATQEKIAQWIEDPATEEEVNRENGTYWV